MTFELCSGRFCRKAESSERCSGVSVYDKKRSKLKIIENPRLQKKLRIGRSFVSDPVWIPVRILFFIKSTRYFEVPEGNSSRPECNTRARSVGRVPACSPCRRHERRCAACARQQASGEVSSLRRARGTRVLNLVRIQIRYRGVPYFNAPLL